MASKKPLKIGPSGINEEFSATDTVAPTHGGTGKTVSDLAGQSSKVLAVNATEDGYDLVPGGGGGGSGLTVTIANIAANTAAGATALTWYKYYCTGTITLTLPTAVGNQCLYTIKNVGTGVVTVATTSAQTIDEALTAEIHFQNNSIDVTTDGTNFKIS